jgi:hypothetical protein
MATNQCQGCGQRFKRDRGPLSIRRCPPCREQRNAKIVQRAHAGDTCAEIAFDFAMSAERVRAIARGGRDHRRGTAYRALHPP